MRRLHCWFTSGCLALGLAAVLPASAVAGDVTDRLRVSGFSHLYVDGADDRIFVSQGTAGGLFVANSFGDTLERFPALTGATDVEPAPDGGSVWTTLPDAHAIADPWVFARGDEPVPTYDVGDACPTAVAPTNTGIWFVDACPGETRELDVLDPATSVVTEVRALVAGSTIVSDGATALYVARPSSTSGSYVVESLALVGGATPTVAPLETSPDLPGSSPRQLALSPDGVTLATSTGTLLDASDLTVLVQHEAPASDRGVSVNSVGQTVVGDGSRIEAYLGAEEPTYNTVTFGDEKLQPFGLQFVGRSLVFVTQDGERYRLHVVQRVKAATALKIAVADRHPAYDEQVQATGSAIGVPDGAKVTLHVVDHAGSGPFLKGTVSAGVAHFVTPPLHANVHLVAQYAGDPGHDKAEVRRPLKFVHHLVDRPKGALGRSHDAYRLKAAQRAHFVTHYRKVFPGACLGYQTFVKREGRWVLYAKIRGCLPVPASGTNRITLPKSLAHAGLRLRNEAAVYANAHWFRKGSSPVVKAKPVYFSFVR